MSPKKAAMLLDKLGKQLDRELYIKVKLAGGKPPAEMEAEMRSEMVSEEDEAALDKAVERKFESASR